MFEEWTRSQWGTSQESIDETIEKLDQPYIVVNFFRHKFLK